MPSNNGPKVHDSIKQKAGLENRFQYLTVNKTAKVQAIAKINEVIELGSERWQAIRSAQTQTITGK